MAYDVAVRCGTSDHTRIKMYAWVAVMLYPVGVWVFVFCLLLSASRGLVAQKRTRLIRALGFLHLDYLPLYFWWELSLDGDRSHDLRAD